jgi:hypothetical protein
MGAVEMNTKLYLTQQIVALEAANAELVKALESIIHDGDYTAPEGMTRIAKLALAKHKVDEQKPSLNPNDCQCLDDNGKPLNQCHECPR